MTDKEMTKLTEDENLAVDYGFAEYAKGEPTDIDWGTDTVNTRKERTESIRHISNELNKLNDASEDIQFLTEWTGENLVIISPDKNIEMNFTLHHTNRLDADNSMIKEMGIFIDEINNIMSSGTIPDPDAAEWIWHDEWKANRDLRKGGFVSYPEITDTKDFIPAMIANYEVVFSAKAVAAVGNGDPMRGGKILAYLNSYLSNLENTKDAK